MNYRDVLTKVVYWPVAWARRVNGGNGWRAVNAVLVGLIGVLFVALSVTLWGPRRSPSTESAPIDGAGSWSTTKRFPSTPVSRRNIFAPLIPSNTAKPVPSAAPTTPPPPPKIPLAERAGHLRLVGILPGQPPQAVVEDPRAQKTFTVSAGQMLGDYNVAEVRDSGVVLSFEDERFELTL